MHDFAEMVHRQRSYFLSQATKPYEFRMEKLRALSDWIDANESAVLDALARDLGKCAFEGYLTEVGMVRQELKDAMRHLARWMRPRRARTAVGQFPGRCRIYSEPYGVALIMSPWNYPFQLTVAPLIGAIAAGNCAVVKPSEYSAATSALLRRMAQELFAPEYVTVVEGGRAENAGLLEETFDFIFFTGSPHVGRLVMEKASAHLTPVSLELGGKSPVIVDETADIALTARRLVWGKLLNAGQTCVAPDYILVDSRVKEPLIKALRSEIIRQYGTNPTLNENYPQIINEKHEQRLNELLMDQPVVYGGLWNQHKLMPTLVVDPDPNSSLMQEEIFGPILPILTYTHFSEALHFIQQREKPLAAYLFSENHKHQDRFLRECSFGGGCLNDTIIHLATTAMPFGGVGHSGMGGYHGYASFKAFSHTKSIVDKSTLIDLPIRYQPVSPWKAKLVRKFMK